MKRIITGVFGLYLFAGFLLTCPSSAFSEDSLIYYILDGSGSMWGRVGGKIKISIAKDVIGKLITEMPQDIHYGLTVYGHRKKGSCSDIEQLIAPGTSNREDAIKKIKEISPKGKTPITDSIQQSINLIKDKELNSTIVLVSDGIETCDKDPCALVKSLKESGIKFVMHVVGFGVGGGDAKELTCIAQNGGGKYFSAGNADELLASLTTVTKSVVEKKEIVIPEPKAEEKPIVQQVAKSSKSVKIKVHGPGRIKIIHDDWVKSPYYWSLIDPETGEEKAKYNDLGIQVVSPGMYQIAWHQERFSTSKVSLEVFTVESRKTTEVPLLTAIDIKVPSWNKSIEKFSLVDPASKEVVYHSKLFGRQLVPPGEYELIWHQKRFASTPVSLGTITVEPDKINSVELKTALQVVPADWVPKDFYLLGLKKEGDQKLFVSYKNFDPQLVPPGKYIVSFHVNRFSSDQVDVGEVEVKKDVLSKFELNTGVKVTVGESIPVPYRIKFINLGEDGKELGSASLKNSLGPIPLGPGTYKVTYLQNQFGNKWVTVVDSFELTAGTLAELEF